MKRKKPTLYGGDANFSSVSLQRKNNYDDFITEDTSNYMNLDTGLEDETNSRKVKKFNGNNTILQRRKYSNGDNLIYYLNNPWENYITVNIFIFYFLGIFIVFALFFFFNLLDFYNLIN